LKGNINVLEIVRQRVPGCRTGVGKRPSPRTWTDWHGGSPVHHDQLSVGDGDQECRIQVGTANLYPVWLWPHRTQIGTLPTCVLCGYGHIAWLSMMLLLTKLLDVKLALLVTHPQQAPETLSWISELQMTGPISQRLPLSPCRWTEAYSLLWWWCCSYAVVHAGFAELIVMCALQWYFSNYN